jgi:small subunit ribosomal protein S5e
MADEEVQVQEVTEAAVEELAVAQEELKVAEIKVFGKWSTDVEVQDISLAVRAGSPAHGFRVLRRPANFPRRRPQDYISVSDKFAKFVPHTAGRYAAKCFRKAQVSFLGTKGDSRLGGTPHQRGFYFLFSLPAL